MVLEINGIDDLAKIKQFPDIKILVVPNTCPREVRDKIIEMVDDSYRFLPDSGKSVSYNKFVEYENFVKEVVANVPPSFNDLEKTRYISKCVSDWIGYDATSYMLDPNDYASTNQVTFNQFNIVSTRLGSCRSISKLVQHIGYEMNLDIGVIDSKLGLDHCYNSLTFLLEGEKVTTLFDVTFDLMHTKAGFFPQFFGKSLEDVINLDRSHGDFNPPHMPREELVADYTVPNIEIAKIDEKLGMCTKTPQGYLYKGIEYKNIINQFDKTDDKEYLFKCLEVALEKLNLKDMRERETEKIMKMLKSEIMPDAGYTVFSLNQKHGDFNMQKVYFLLEKNDEYILFTKEDGIFVEVGALEISEKIEIGELQYFYEGDEKTPGEGKVARETLERLLSKEVDIRKNIA